MKEQTTNIHTSAPASRANKTVITLLRTALAQGQQPALTISSASMSPLLRPGDRVYLATAAPAALQPGEIITVLENDSLLTHRFWGRQQHHGRFYLLTRGDRPLQFDPAHPETALLGRVVARQRGRRYLDLTTGAGGWLTQHAGKAYRRYQRWVAPNGRLRPRWQRALPSLSLRLWAHIVDALVTLVANTPPPPTQR